MLRKVYFDARVQAEATRFMTRGDFARICDHLAEHPDSGSRMRDLPLFRLNRAHPPCRVWYYHASPDDPRLLLLKITEGRGRFGLRSVRDSLEFVKLVLELHKLLGP